MMVHTENTKNSRDKLLELMCLVIFLDKNI